MYEKILLPLDGCTLSECTLPYARFLATALHIPVELLHAIDPDLIAVCGNPRYVNYEKSLEENLKERNLPYLTNSLQAPMSMTEEQAESIQEVGDQIGKEAQDYLDEKAEQLRAQGVKKLSKVVVEGPAAESIITLAREKPNSWVVMGTHGRSGVSRWVLGSITERVTRHANDPVLVIRASSAQVVS